MLGHFDIGISVIVFIIALKRPTAHLFFFFEETYQLIESPKGSNKT